MERLALFGIDLHQPTTSRKTGGEDPTTTMAQPEPVPLVTSRRADASGRHSLDSRGAGDPRGERGEGPPAVRHSRAGAADLDVQDDTDVDVEDDTA